MVVFQNLIVTRYIDRATAGIVRTRKEIEKTEKVVKNTTMRFFGLGMGMLFMGMALRRFATKALSAIINSYKIMGAEQSVFNVKTRELSAAWEFFKFSMIDALSQSGLFLVLINWLIAIVNWLSRLSPGWKVFILISFAVMVVVGTIMMLIGQLGLFLIGISMTGVTAQGVFFAISRAILLLITNIELLIVKTFMWMLMHPILALGWIGSIIAVIAVFLLLRKKFGSTTAAIKAWIAAIVLAFAFLAQFIITGVVTAIQMLALAVIHLIDLLNKIPGVNISTRGLTGFVMAKPDIMGPVAEWLDRIGLNPPAVEEAIPTEAELAKEAGIDYDKLAEAVERGNDRSAEKRGYDVIANTTIQ